MNRSYRPDGFSDVVPYLVVNDAAQLIDFARQAFGAKELARHLRPDGSVMHAEVRIGDSVIELGGANEKWPARPGNLHVFVPDVDAAYARALAAGATSLYPVTDHPYGERSGGVQDVTGTHWFIATVTDAEARKTPDTATAGTEMT